MIQNGNGLQKIKKELKNIAKGFFFGNFY